MRKPYRVVIDGHAQTVSASTIAVAVYRALTTLDRELRSKGPRLSLERRLRKQSFVEIRVTRHGVSSTKRPIPTPPPGPSDD